jgi:GGDEF domain-containing protein
MKGGHLDDVKQTLDAVLRRSIVDCVLIYNEEMRGTYNLAHFGGEAFVVAMQAIDPEGTAHKAKARRLKTETRLLVSEPESEVIEA